ncbi:MarR family transcriptional regulator [Actinoallomurus sp. NPDC050550]|uniref:MarR family winged helix-turn-helix transcriptional regulator n=1 Tax=Actinoallomurus sp. NPDC050550 TaxID=3154937 RepID=UPI0033F4BD74
MPDREITVARLTAAIRRYQREIDAFDQAAAERLGLNRTDLRCVDLLLDRPLSLTELAEHAGLSQSAMTTALDRLERAGYACRTRDPNDRRRFLVQLTPALLTRIAEIFKPFAAEATAELDRYSVSELETLVRFFADGSERRARHARRIRTTPKVRRPAARRQSARPDDVSPSTTPSDS